MTKDDLVSKDTALKMAIKEMTDAIPHLDIHFDDYFEAIQACKDALADNPFCKHGLPRGVCRLGEKDCD